MREAYAVLTAAGAGKRLGADQPKALVEIGGRSLLSWAVQGLTDSGQIAAICVTAPKGNIAEFRRQLTGVRIPVSVVAGGPSRQASVRQGLLGVQRLVSQLGLSLDSASAVLVHDAARCFTPPELIAELVRHVREGAPAVVPGLRVTDTIKRIIPVPGTDCEMGLVQETLDREALRSIQTPQAFQWEVLFTAHQDAQTREGTETTAATDDAGVVEANGVQVWVIPGDVRAAKITTGEDLHNARDRMK